MATNMKENGFETMIVRYMVDNNHYEEGNNSDYNKIYAIDEVRLFRFLHDTQSKKLSELRIEENAVEKKKFLDRLSRKLSDDGVINIIRKGMKYKNQTIDFYMVRPSEGNQDAKESYEKNIFSITRQLRYSVDYGKLALDMGDSSNAAIKWFYAEDDELAMGILEALNGGGISDSTKTAIYETRPVLTGCGGLDEYYEVLRGNSYADIVDNFDGVMSVTYSPAMIQSAIQDMVDYLNGETVEQDHVIECENVVPENVADYPSF